MTKPAEPSVIESLEREPLRNIVLLKHLEAFPDHTQVHHAASASGTGTLVLLEVAASAYDSRTYPAATFAALISSDHPSLTRQLLDAVPPDVGVVFKLSSNGDRDVVAARFSLERTTSVLSFTARPSRFAHDDGVRLTAEPSEAMYTFFASQDHDRDWLEPLLRSGRAFTCVLEHGGQPVAVCFAFENYRRVWEVGGVFTPPEHRGQGLAARVVRTALAELERRQLIPRYQVHEENVPSVRLAQSIGLDQFLQITHFLHAPGATTR
ncbi:GNAT family N-acetyltransferase [Reyranella sp. CPCC 100927]|uniref:GNAT family N-acetyltransferase n=1 Tax=Reyranella sp. CPCC 100927 TaxID=2599616 RepID=UPI0011B3F639|nr:GNAT family N-acetyltransferase [Reyranella sp. CPCC 100927]TWT10820.1 GNAT family N-acetyltransferase [Reyranella sp. CPCC 100927]